MKKALLSLIVITLLFSPVVVGQFWSKPLYGLFSVREYRCICGHQQFYELTETAAFETCPGHNMRELKIKRSQASKRKHLKQRIKLTLPAIAKQKMILIRNIEKLVKQGQEIILDFIDKAEEFHVLVFDTDQNSFSNAFAKKLTAVCTVKKCATKFKTRPKAKIDHSATTTQACRFALGGS